MLDIFITVLAFAGTLMTLLGLFTVYHWIRQPKAPADSSNRINAIRRWWFSLTREDLLVDWFPWLKNDEMDNLK